MCLTITDIRKFKAEEDIVQYKPLDIRTKNNKSILVSPYQAFEYQLGKRYSIDPNDLDFELDKSKAFGTVELGFHSYDEPITDTHFPMFESIIPKDAYYYAGQFRGEPSKTSSVIIIQGRSRELTEQDKIMAKTLLSESPIQRSLQLAALSKTETTFKNNLKKFALDDFINELAFVKYTMLLYPDLCKTTTFIKWAEKNANQVIDI